MATGAVIGALRIVLGADTAALEKALKSAQGELAAFGKFATKALAFVGVAASINEFKKSIEGAINAADEMGKAAQKVGIPVEELSKLKFAAELANVSFETLQKSLGHFGKQVAEVGAGGVNELTKALEAMGIQVRDSDGALKSQS